ncbi:hypothetical protein F7725_025800, partial [Dissostichus mawsoni]
MATDWLESVVSINCGLTLGVYQGSVSSVDHRNQTISLKLPFHNGVRCSLQEVTFREPSLNPVLIRVLQQNRASSLQNVRDKETLFILIFIIRGQTARLPSPSYAEASQRKNMVRNGGPRTRDDECFGGGTDDNMDSDFDFEGNLALFDKAAVFSKISSLSSEGEKQTAETIIPSSALCNYHAAVQPYVNSSSETGTNHRALTWSLPVNTKINNVRMRKENKEPASISVVVFPSCAVIGCAETQTQQQSGGSAERPPAARGGAPVRASPAGGAGRQLWTTLANHQVETVLFLPNCLKMQECVSREVTLYSRSSSQQVASVRDLPQTPVDLVINCLDHHENPLLREQSWYQSAALWANQNRAPVLSIDPAVGTVPQSVEAKWTLFLGLPLDVEQTESKVYLCDVGIPKRVFQ